MKIAKEVESMVCECCLDCYKIDACNCVCNFECDKCNFNHKNNLK